MSATTTAPPPAAREGPDLASLLGTLFQPWRELHRWPPLSWLAPQPAVRLLQADGTDSLWAGDAPIGGDPASAPFTAVELPEALRLDCRLRLPPMPEADLHDAVALEVRTQSPFDPADLVWGFRARPGEGGALDVHAVLASRRAVASHLAGLAERVGPRAPEVWACDDAGRAVVVRGFGEAARERRAARGRWLAASLLVVALGLAAAAAITPTVQLKLRALQAAEATRQAEQRAGPLLAQREALVRAQADVDALRTLLAERVEPLAALDLLTQAIPDDTFLQRLQLQGTKVTIGGQTPNTAALMNALSSQPGVRDVRSPTAATRAMGGRENFTIELSLAPPAAPPAAAGAASGVNGAGS